MPCHALDHSLLKRPSCLVVSNTNTLHGMIVLTGQEKKPALYSTPLHCMPKDEVVADTGSTSRFLPTSTCSMVAK